MVEDQRQFGPSWLSISMASGVAYERGINVWLRNYERLL